MDNRNGFFLNSAIGSIALIILFYVPLAPVLGGIVAGFLERRSLQAGARAGLLTGLIAIVPLYFALVFLVPLFSIAPFGRPTVPIDTVSFSAGLFGIVVLYVIPFSTIGGVIGSYLHKRAFLRESGCSTEPSSSAE
ncbi:DUF5518 domain-containing protein [Halalkaliarchaeum sp. AArc-GB]|uniref:DUF5518 domain-containing protein n=1 Tax=Halalkaliarchaeum sp. AArc-GB TaxID=3074078 RepID=UPI00285934F5|nr:DUF5518 domain-containing protein [Halalkaliarchaeum sp. AArc-GB]MDR5673163.1 DUF5518 domain-containing protein [Halalkaliarchaeum sp. AArc-GB]